MAALHATSHGRRRIAEHQTVREQFRAADRRTKSRHRGRVRSKLFAQVTADVDGKQGARALRRRSACRIPVEGKTRSRAATVVVTAVAVRPVDASSTPRVGSVTDGSPGHPKMIGQIQRRLKRIEEAIEEGGTMGPGDARPSDPILVEGIPIRLTGQDTDARNVPHPDTQFFTTSQKGET